MVSEWSLRKLGIVIKNGDDSAIILDHEPIWRFTAYCHLRNTLFTMANTLCFSGANRSNHFERDWPLTDPANGRNGGYCEGCCSTAGFLYIPEVGGGGVRIAHTTDTNEWEGIFHWNDLLSSQFLTSGVSGEPGVRYKYEVTPSIVGRLRNFTVSYREGGSAIDLFLFSTHTNLMEYYSQADLDQLFISPRPRVSGGLVGTKATFSWPTSAIGFALESTSTLSPPSWNPVTNAVTVVGDQNTVSVDVVGGGAFYRLSKP